jgi:hypothetical protein
MLFTAPIVARCQFSAAHHICQGFCVSNLQHSNIKHFYRLTSALLRGTLKRADTPP